MTKLILRGLAARKLRATLTAVAVVLGVALVSGTYVFTDTLALAWGDIDINPGADVVVRTDQVVSTPDEGGVPAFDASLLDRVRRVEGVEGAVGGIFSPVTILDQDGDPVAAGGAPMFAASELPEEFTPFGYPEGRPPSDAGEVALDTGTADRFGFEAGDRIRVAGAQGAKEYEISGLTTFGGLDTSPVAIVVATLPEAQRLTDREGRLDQISVAGAEGLSPQELKRRVAAAVPDGLAVRTGEEDTDYQGEEVEDLLAIVRTAFLSFGGIALFAAAFTIFNTISITVVQRMRELGMLRALGASRGQVLLGVGAEALAIGVAASLVGLLAGLGVAPALGALMEAFGAVLPSGGPVVATRTIVVALLAGTSITLLASLVPALRAARVSPLAVLREGAAPRRPGKHRLALALVALTIAAGVALILVGLLGGFDSDGTVLALVGAGAAVVFVGVTLISPRLVGPLAALVGRPLERFGGVAGHIARENAARNPARTAVTAGALMIGIALVTFAAVFAAGAKSSTNALVGERFVGDLVIQATDAINPVPAASARAASQVEGVAVVAEMRTSQARLPARSEDVRVTGVDRQFPQLMSLDWSEGSNELLAELGPDEAALDEEWADAHHIAVGERFRLVTPTSATVVYLVRGSFDNPRLTGDVVMSNETLAADFGEQRDARVLVKVADDLPVDLVERRLNRMLEQRFPMAQALDRDGFEDRTAESLDQILGPVYGLLALAVLVSLLGIVNTLALSIHERTREIGLLRAIGVSARQMRRVVRYEAVITALIGAVLGSVVGLGFGWLVIQPLADEGFRISVPAGTVAVMLVVATVAGVLASIVPARRATRVEILAALAYE